MLSISAISSLLIISSVLIITSGQSNLTIRLPGVHRRHTVQSYSLDDAYVRHAPLSNTWFLGPTQVHIPNGISISSAIFAQLTADGPCSLQRATPLPLKIAPSQRGIWTHLIHGSLGPPESTSKSLQRFCRVHNRVMDKPHYSQATGLIYVVLRCGLRVCVTVSMSLRWSVSVCLSLTSDCTTQVFI